jgi:hypothetical protein
LWLALSAGGLLTVTAPGHLHAEPAASAAPSAPTGGAAESPVTVVATHYVKPGCKTAFETLINETFEHNRGIAGDPSAAIVQPSQPNSRAYTVIVRFNRTTDYRRWLDSPERAVFFDRVEQLADGPPNPQLRSGMEVWVTPPDLAGAGAPDPYKTIAVTFLALYPTYMLSSVVLAPVMAGWPLYATAAVRSGLAISLAGLGVIQLVSHTFQGWLFPPPAACRAG